MGIVFTVSKEACACSIGLVVCEVCCRKNDLLFAWFFYSQQAGCGSCFWDCELQWCWGPVSGILLFLFGERYQVSFFIYKIYSFSMSRKTMLMKTSASSIGWIYYILCLGRESYLNVFVVAPYLWHFAGFITNNFSGQYRRMSALFKQGLFGDLYNNS